MGTLEALPDHFRDFLVALAHAQAEFVLIGGWAIAVHGRPRATEDLDDVRWLEGHPPRKH